ncbi:MAG: hypothetical protein ACK587_04015, partial [Cyanobacteriota bacterium]
MLRFRDIDQCCSGASPRRKANVPDLEPNAEFFGEKKGVVSGRRARDFLKSRAGIILDLEMPPSVSHRKPRSLV